MNRQRKKIQVKKYKFGYKVPPIARIDITLKLDDESGNNKWKESI